MLIQTCGSKSVCFASIQIIHVYKETYIIRKHKKAPSRPRTIYRLLPPYVDRVFRFVRFALHLSLFSNIFVDLLVNFALFAVRANINEKRKFFCLLYMRKRLSRAGSDRWVNVRNYSTVISWIHKLRARTLGISNIFFIKYMYILRSGKRIDSIFTT